MAAQQWPATVTAETARTSHCFRCNTVPDDDEPPLQRCSRCRARNYCSRQCQRSDWENHKKECATLAAGGKVPDRRRTTFRLNGQDLFGMGSAGREGTSMKPEDLNGREPNTVYHLKITRRHISDVAFAPPTSNFASVMERMAGIMEAYGSLDGLETFADVGSAAIISPRSLQHFNAPLPDGTIVRFDVIREDNAAVAAVVDTSTTFTVRCCSFMSPEEGSMMMAARDRVQVKDIDVFKTFTTKSAALSFARTRYAELQEDKSVPIGRVRGPAHPAPDVIGLIERTPEGAQRYEQLVDVHTNER